VAGDGQRSSLEARYGAFYSRVGLAIAWTSTNAGPEAKACKESGPRAWKRAKPLSPEPGAAAGFFGANYATRNPVIPAGANRLVLFDFDGAPIEELAVKYELALPAGAWRARTARGEHAYGSAPSGHPGLKVEVTRGRVTVIADGYLLAPPSRHPSGLVYAFENVDVDNGSERPPAVDEALLDRIRELAGESREHVAALLDSGDPIDIGDRHAALMHHAARLRGEGLGAKAIRAALEELAERFTVTTGRRGEIDGVVRWVMTKPAPPPLDPADIELLRLLDDLPDALARAVEPARPKPAKPKRRAISRRPLGGIAAERVELLGGTPLPAAAPTLVAGIGGLGKSALGLSYAKQVTDRGDAVLVISYEDAAGAVIRPRFEALGGDLDRLFVLQVDALEGEVSFPADLPELDRHVRETGARLVIVDPVSASIDLKLDAHRDQDVRVVLGQLARLAERERFAALQIAHLNKAPGVDPYFRINGSTAFYNAARLVVTVTPDAADPDWQRIVAAHKFNYGAVPAPERWRVEPVTSTRRPGRSR
jgi:AAA domain/Bifunctional DNA primase/polymerase, N-terminal